MQFSSNSKGYGTIHQCSDFTCWHIPGVQQKTSDTKRSCFPKQGFTMSLVRRVPGFPLLTVLHYPDIQQLSVQSCPRWATGKKSLFLKDKLEYYPFNDLGESVTISTVSTTALHNVKGEKHTRFHSRLCWWKINPHPESLHTRSTPSLRYHKGVWDSCRKKLCHEHKKLVF